MGCSCQAPPVAKICVKGQLQKMRVALQPRQATGTAAVPVHCRNTGQDLLHSLEQSFHHIQMGCDASSSSTSLAICTAVSPLLTGLSEPTQV